MMKKNVLIAGIIFMIYFISAGTLAFAQESDADANRAITEIGILVNAQKFQMAMTKCNAALEKYPNESFLYYWRGSINSSIGEKRLAIADFNKAIELDGKNARAYVLRGICKADMEDKEGALADYNKAIELDPDDSSAYSMRAMVRLDLGDMEGADHDLDMSNKLMNSKVDKDADKKN